MKTIDLSRIARPNVLTMKSYSSARDDFEGDASVFLDANENPHSTLYNRYPDPHQLELKEKIASLKNVKTSQLFLGNGSDEAIDLIFRAFCVPGKDNVIIPQPTYGMYSVSAAINDIAISSVSLTKSFDIGMEAALQAITKDTKIIFLCSPNNPSGNLLSRNKIKTLLDSFNGLVVVDEAYIDFTNETSLLDWLNDYQNLLILQTLSKAWGLAALRLGICFGHPEVIAMLNKIKPPYNINQTTQQLALEQLDLQDQKQAWVKDIIAQRDQLIPKLQKIKIVETIFPSDANFLLVKVNDPEKTYRHLVHQGIIVRDRSKVAGCEGCLRITVGTESENKLLIKALKEL